EGRDCESVVVEGCQGRYQERDQGNGCSRRPTQNFRLFLQRTSQLVPTRCRKSGSTRATRLTSRPARANHWSTFRAIKRGVSSRERRANRTGRRTWTLERTSTERRPNLRMTSVSRTSA